MYITENQTIGDSVLFLLSARRSLAEIVESAGSENSEALAEFLINEASDYEIMSLLVEGVLPEEKYDHVSEVSLFSYLKECVLMDAAMITEAIGQNAFADFMGKVDSLFPALSTQAPVLEFFAMQNKDVAVATILEGETAYFGNLKAMKSAGAANMPVPGGSVSATGQIGQAASNVLASLKSAGQSAMDTAAKLGPKISAFAKTGQGQALGGAALAALLIYASAKTYKRFLSKAAKACSGQSGAAKSQCMKEYRGKAKAAQAADLAKAASACAKTKNPEACKAAINKKVAALR